MLIPTVLSGVLAVAVAAALTPLVRLGALKIGAVDAPGERRVHKTTIPRMGGIGIAAAYTLALAVVLNTSLLDVPDMVEKAFLGYIGGAFVIFLAGIYDDVRQLGAKRKLSAQLIAATIAWWGGARIQEVVNIPSMGAVDIGPVLAYAATVVWILAFTNAINLIDGLDGLAGGVVFFAALTNLAVAFISNNFFAASLNAALAGAVLGFLFYNFNPAKIFMGDTGSLFLGYALSASALLTTRQKESTLAALLVPLIAMGLPLTDTILAMVRRMLQRRSIFAADKSHLHHRFLEMGLTHRRTVLILYACTAALSALALVVAMGQDWQVGGALLSSVLVLAGIVRVSGMFGRVLHPEISESARILGERLPGFVVAVNGDRSLASVAKRLDELFVGACEWAELRVFEGLAWRFQAPTSAREDGNLSKVEVDLLDQAGEAIGSLQVGCRTTTATPPAEIVLILSIIAQAVASGVGCQEAATDS